MIIIQEQPNPICTTEQCMRIRPLWQRVFYPIVGGMLIFFGAVMGLVPGVPGFPFIIIGISLAACMHPRLELAVRRYMHKVGHAIKAKLNLKRSYFPIKIPTNFFLKFRKQLD